MCIIVKKVGTENPAKPTATAATTTHETRSKGDVLFRRFEGRFEGFGSLVCCIDGLFCGESFH